ncbi:MAG: Flp pilus assembly protein CpaB [Myxococcales bacterium]|nr:Flp pilus assembly protein CpaB [Myxococcales bacterium]
MKQGAWVAALLMGLMGAGLLYLYKQRFEAAVGGGDKVEVMVAVTDLKLGDNLTPEKIATRGIPASYIESRHIRLDQIDSVLGVRVRARISAGEAVLSTDLAISGANSRDLSGLVMPRMRAITIPASDALTFDGLLRPGDRVDVLLTVKDRRTGSGTTTPLLQNLIVLAIGRQMGVPSEGNKNSLEGQISTVTLGVKPVQGQTLANAMQDGKLTLLLRNVDDIRILRDDVPVKAPDAK